ncbi:MAG TPA: hypothetical protein VH253_02820 [Phycisphaerae bacterium]|nr:hypothetical protein [Phycisphaerae bacterium]
MVIRRLLPLLLPVALAAAAPSPPPGGAPATRRAPATAPAAAATHASPAAVTDLSTPQATVISFLTALAAGDEAGAKSAIVFTDPKSEGVANLFLDILATTNKIQRRAKTKFGAGAAADTFGDPDAALAARVESVKKASPAITNNDAALSLPADEAQHQQASVIALKKIGAQWKIDATSLFNLDKQPPDNLARNVTLARKLLDINRAIAANIDSGKYASAAEAYQDWWTRSFAAAAPPAATQSSTAPASAPPPFHDNFTN